MFYKFMETLIWVIERPTFFWVSPHTFSFILQELSLIKHTIFFIIIVSSTEIVADKFIVNIGQLTQYHIIGYKMVTFVLTLNSLEKS